jgi:hypothetical protein
LISCAIQPNSFVSCVTDAIFCHIAGYQTSLSAIKKTPLQEKAYFMRVERFPSSHASETHQSKPKILIDSSRNWPERIVYDTSLPTTLAVVPVAQEAVRASPLVSMAQMSAPTAPKQPTHIQVVREKPVKIAKRVSRQKFASFQQQRPPNLFGSWW